MMHKIDTLTPEQLALIEQHRTRWSQLRRATGAADRGVSEMAVRLAYRVAGLAPPLRIAWTGGPLEMMRAWEHTAQSEAIGPNVRGAVFDAARQRAAEAVAERATSRVATRVLAAFRPDDRDIAGAATMRALLRDIKTSRPLPSNAPLARLIGTLLAPFRRRDGTTALVEAAYGQHELMWLGAYEYFREVLGLDAETEHLRGLWLLAVNTGWICRTSGSAGSASARVRSASTTAAACIRPPARRSPTRTAAASLPGRASSCRRW